MSNKLPGWAYKGIITTNLNIAHYYIKIELPRGEVWVSLCGKSNIDDWATLCENKKHECKKCRKEKIDRTTSKRQGK